MPTLIGYAPGAFTTVSGAGIEGVGGRFVLDASWDVDSDSYVFTITDIVPEDTTLDGDQGLADESGDDLNQSAVVTTALGAPIASGQIYAESGHVFTDEHGGTVTVYRLEIAGTLVGWVADGAIQPGNTYTITSITDPGIIGPAYSTFVDAAYDVDANNIILGTSDDDTIIGDAGSDDLDGGAGNDSLMGGTGNDIIDGASGNDTITGGDGNDTLDGNSGTDRAIYTGAVSGHGFQLSGGNIIVSDQVGSEGTDTLSGFEVLSFAGTDYDLIIGTDGDETITPADGTPDVIVSGNGADVLTGVTGRIHYVGGTGTDSVAAGSANDTVLGEAGADSVNAGAGDDYVDGGSDQDSITGGLGDDLIYGGAGSDDIAGDDDQDNLFGGADDDTLSGGAGNDLLEGGAGSDVHNGGAGNDTVSYAGASAGIGLDLRFSIANTGEAAGDSFDSIESFAGSGFLDRISGQEVADILYGGGGTDILRGRAGDDSLYGDDGGDLIIGGVGADAMFGGNGTDRAQYNQATSAVTASLANPGVNTGEASGDTYSSIENLYGSTFADTLYGDGNANTLWGAAGDDTLEGGVGADVLFGGAGTDLASFTNAASGVIVDLQVAIANTGDAAGDAFISIEGAIGSADHDRFFGNADGNIFFGGVGNDIFFGRLGDDTLYGDAGNDLMTGGAGADAYFGGAGIDRAQYELAASGVTVSLANPGSNTGDAAGDTYDSIENIYGSGHADTLTGDANDNSLWGAGGSDVFVLFDGWGDDVVADFDAADGSEKIDLSAVTAIIDFTDLSANHLSSVGNDAVITDGVSSLTLTGVSTGDLDGTDFVF